MVAIAARGEQRTLVLRAFPDSCVTVGVENPSTVEMVARVDNSSSVANVVAAGRRRLRREEDFIVIMLTTQK